MDPNIVAVLRNPARTIGQSAHSCKVTQRAVGALAQIDREN